MAIAKRIFLFLALNFLVILMVSLILNVFHIQPFLSHYGINYGTLMIFCLIWGMSGAFISLALSRVMAKWMMGVKLVDLHTNDLKLRELLEMVRELSQTANIPMPQVGVYSSPEVNAFATGPSKKRSLVAVSSGLLERMDRADVRAIIGHELSHIANGDMVTMTLLQGVVNAFVMFLARVLAYVFSGMGRNRESESGGGNYMSFVLLVYLFDFIFMILGSMLVASYSRWREFRADAGGARLAGKNSMISALQALRTTHMIHDEQHEKPAFNSLKISDSSKKGSFLRFFSTHPPLEDRIERLQHQ